MLNDKYQMNAKVLMPKKGAFLQGKKTFLFKAWTSGPMGEAALSSTHNCVRDLDKAYLSFRLKGEILRFLVPGRLTVGQAGNAGVSRIW